jgi:hypothetical protein
VTSERWLDHRPDRYPPHHRGVADGIPCADIEASRALATPTAGIAPLLSEVWERYRIPLAVTEAHIDANREDQLRWLLEIWEAAKVSRRQRRRPARRHRLVAARLLRLEQPGHAEPRLLRTGPLRRALARTAPDRAGAHDARAVVRQPAVAPGAARPGLVAPSGPLPVPAGGDAGRPHLDHGRRPRLVGTGAARS